MGLLTAVASTKLTNKDLEVDYSPINETGALLKITKVSDIDDPMNWKESIPDWAKEQAKTKLRVDFEVVGGKHKGRKLNSNVAFAGEFKWVGIGLAKAAGINPQPGNPINPLDMMNRVVMADLSVYTSDAGKEYQNINKFRKSVPTPRTTPETTPVAISNEDGAFWE